MLHEKGGDSVLVGRIKVPCPGGKGEVIPVNVQPNQLHTIHGRFLS